MVRRTYVLPQRSALLLGMRLSPLCPHSSPETEFDDQRTNRLHSALPDKKCLSLRLSHNALLCTRVDVWLPLLTESAVISARERERDWGRARGGRERVRVIYVLSAKVR